MFFWVFPRRQFVVGRCFGNLYRFNLQRLVVDCLLPAFEDGTDTGFRNVGQLQIDAGEIPKRTFSIFKFILVWNDTLHVSDGLSVHHQIQTDTAVCLLAGTR